MRLHEGAEDEVVLNGLECTELLLCDSEGLWITEDSTHNARALLLPPDAAAGDRTAPAFRTVPTAHRARPLPAGRAGRDRILEIERQKSEL